MTKKFNPEIVAKADEYIWAFLRTLTPKRRDVAVAAQGLIHLGYHPSTYKVCKQIGRRGLNQEENMVRYRVLEAYSGTNHELKRWMKLARVETVKTGLMHKESGIHADNKVQ